MMKFCKCGQIAGQCNCRKRDQVKGQTTTQRGYGYDWQKLSKAYRVAHPMCSVCLDKGKITAVEHVHHIVPIRVDRSRRLDWDNLMSLCEPCHKEIEGKNG